MYTTAHTAVCTQVQEADRPLEPAPLDLSLLPTQFPHLAEFDALTLASLDDDALDALLELPALRVVKAMHFNVEESHVHRRCNWRRVEVSGAVRRVAFLVSGCSSWGTAMVAGTPMVALCWPSFTPHTLCHPVPCVCSKRPAAPSPVAAALAMCARPAGAGPACRGVCAAAARAHPVVRLPLAPGARERRRSGRRPRGARRAPLGRHPRAAAPRRRRRRGRGRRYGVAAATGAGRRRCGWRWRWCSRGGGSGGAAGRRWRSASGERERV